MEVDLIAQGENIMEKRGRPRTEVRTTQYLKVHYRKSRWKRKMI